MVDATRTLAAQWTRTTEDGKKDTITGTLVISPDNPTHLIHLTRDFASDEDSIEGFLTGQSEVDVYPVLHGQTEDGLYTAIDSRVVRSSRNFGSSKLSDIVLQPSFVIKGNVTLNEHELAVTDVTLRFWDQDAWAQWFNLRLKNGTPEDRTVYIEQVPPPSHSLKLDGVEVSIRDASQTSYFPLNHGKISIDQTSVFDLKFDDEVPLKDFLSNWMAPLSFWVSSGTRRTSGIEVMSIQNRNWTMDGDGSPVTSWLTVVPRNPKRKFSETDEILFLHKLRDFDFARQLPIVIETFAKHRPAIEQYLDYIHNRPGTPMVRLTVLAQLVETFDRSLDPDPALTEQVIADAKAVAAVVASEAALNKYVLDAKRAVMESVRPTLANRLKRLDVATGKIVSELVGEGVDWKGSIAAIRNAIVHGLPSSLFFLTNVIPIQISVDILEVLFELRLLVALGFTPDEVKKIVKEDDFSWFGRTHHVRTYLGSFDNFKNQSA